MKSKMKRRPQPREEKLPKREIEDLTFDLVLAFSKLKSPVEAALFTQDLLTEYEVRTLAKRLRIAKLLLSGKTYREVIDILHTGQNTVGKVAVWLRGAGEGFRKIISRLPEREKFSWENISEWNSFKARYAAYFPFAEVNLKRRRASKQEDLERKLRQALAKLPKKSALSKEVQRLFEEYQRRV